MPLIASNKSDATTTARYTSVPVSTLRTGDKIEFSLYAKIQDSYLLQHRGGQAWLLSRANQLEQAGTKELWVHDDELEAYFSYLQHWNQAILDDPKATVAERITRCYDAGTVSTRESMTNPASEAAFSTFSYSMEVAVQLLEKYEFSFSAVRGVFQRAPNLFSHSMHVCLYGLLLGRAVGYHPLTHLGMALAFHDAGKLDLPEEVLEKPGPLDDEDWLLIQSHASLGVQRSQLASRLPAVARDVIQNHHERMDGLGYPRGIEGAQLTLASRIAAIVNTFDSRTCDRPYRKGRSSFEVARDMLALGKPAFDPDLMKTFVQILAT